MSNPAPLAVTSAIHSFAYHAQDANGGPISGTIDAADIDAAAQRLQSLGLRIVSIEPVLTPAPHRPLRSADFLAFNEQLAQLTAAGLPVEHGLKLIAQDLGHGRLASTIRSIADELDRGTSLPDALAHHEKQFPPLYARLVEAGVRSGNLSGLLMNLGGHLEMIRRLRASLWRACSYPLMVLAALAIVLIFLNMIVFPQFRHLYDQFYPVPVHSVWGTYMGVERHAELPLYMQFVFAFGATIPYLVAGIFLLLIVFPILLRVIDRGGTGLFETIIFRVPLIGPILRQSLIARWCDAARLGVNAGMDLPGAIRLAGDAVASPGLTQSGTAMAAHLERGESLSTLPSLGLLPRTIPAAIELSSTTNNLPETLDSLSQMYRRQAQSRLDTLPTILTPLLLLLIAILIGITLGGLLFPLFQFIQTLVGK